MADFVEMSCLGRKFGKHSVLFWFTCAGVINKRNALSLDSSQTSKEVNISWLKVTILEEVPFYQLID